MKKNTINVLAFFAIGLAVTGIYRSTDLQIAELTNIEGVITKNAITDTYKLKILVDSKEIVKEVEYKDVLAIVKKDREISEYRLDEAKKELEEIKILEKLVNNGIELNPEQLEEIFPRAMKKIQELDEKETMEESETLNLNKNKPRMI